jgi:hypothetical protein
MVGVQTHILWGNQMILQPVRQSAVPSASIWIQAVDERDVGMLSRCCGLSRCSSDTQATAQGRQRYPASRKQR